MEQLGLFARRGAPTTCPRWPGSGCVDLARCPGREECERLGEETEKRMRAEGKVLEAAAADSAGAVPPVLEADLTPEELAQPDLGVCPPDVGCAASPAAECEPDAGRPSGALRPTYFCRGCGFTTPFEDIHREHVAACRHDAVPACLTCGTTAGVVRYAAGHWPAALAGHHCMSCADRLVREAKEAERHG